MSSAVARGEFASARPAIPPLVGMVIPLVSVLLFSAFVAFGLAYRRRRDAHKRLMAMGAIAMLAPALGRAIGTLAGIGHPALFFGATVLFIAAIGVHDWRTGGQVHPVTLWGGLLLVASFPVRLLIGNTDLWLTFAGWLTREERSVNATDNAVVVGKRAVMDTFVQRAGTWRLFACHANVIPQL